LVSDKENGWQSIGKEKTSQNQNHKRKTAVATFHSRKQFIPLARGAKYKKG